MTEEELRWAFAPILDDLAERSTVAERFIDKNVYRLYIATLWANVVLNPEDAGIQESDLELLHNVLNERLAEVIGKQADIADCFRFISSKAGEAAMAESRLSSTHRDLLTYFSSMILDPDGHRRWMRRLGEDSDA
ncbi:MAG: hypothetical protein R3E82_01185 [Pseudomonadales bacterium]